MSRKRSNVDFDPLNSIVDEIEDDFVDREYLDLHFD